MELQSLRKSDNPLEKRNAEVITMLQEIKTRLMEVRDEPRRPRMHPRVVNDLMMTTYDRLTSRLDPEVGKEPTREQLDCVRSSLERFDRAINRLGMEAGTPPDMFMRHRRTRGKSEKP